MRTWIAAVAACVALVGHAPEAGAQCGGVRHVYSQANWRPHHPIYDDKYCFCHDFCMSPGGCRDGWCFDWMVTPIDCVTGEAGATTKLHDAWDQCALRLYPVDETVTMQPQPAMSLVLDYNPMEANPSHEDCSAINALECGPEPCDGLDNDGDGQADENCPDDCGDQDGAPNNFVVGLAHSTVTRPRPAS